MCKINKTNCNTTFGEFFQVLSTFKSADVGSVFQERISGTFKDCFVGFGGFPVFAVTHFIDVPGELGRHIWGLLSARPQYSGPAYASSRPGPARNPGRGPTASLDC